MLRGGPELVEKRPIFLSGKGKKTVLIIQRPDRGLEVHGDV